MIRANGRAVVVAAAALANAAAALAGIVVEDRPASLVARNVVMHEGAPYVRLSELAAALGGSVRYEPAKQRYEIQPGALALLRFRAGPVRAVPERRRGDASGEAGAIGLAIGGREVARGGGAVVRIGPGEIGVSLRLIARLLGGDATFDAKRAAWVLPTGAAGSPLRLR